MSTDHSGDTLTMTRPHGQNMKLHHFCSTQMMVKSFLLGDLIPSLFAQLLLVIHSATRVSLFVDILYYLFNNLIQVITNTCISDNRNEI